jgi:hypothetical protein
MVTNFTEEPGASTLYLEMEAAGSCEAAVTTHCLTQYPDLADHNTTHTTETCLVVHLNVTAGCNTMCMLSALQCP